MPNISSIVKNVRNIMRQDRGVSGDAQRLEQLGWMNPELEQLARIRDRFKQYAGGAPQ
jgi:type I restriction enzyme M protein